MRIPRSLTGLVKARRQVHRLNETTRAIRSELGRTHAGDVVMDVSSGYDNRAMGWHDVDEARPPIGFHTNPC